MSTEVYALIMAVVGVIGGAFGVKLLDRWFDRDKDKAKADGEERQRQFTDNEHARRWLSEQLEERDDELKIVRENERALLEKMADLTAKVARQEERGDAHTRQIDDLKATVKQLGSDYAEMKAERDAYRIQKHEAENRLTAESLGRQLAEREVAARDQEIERLRGQLEARGMPS